MSTDPQRPEVDDPRVLALAKARQHRAHSNPFNAGFWPPWDGLSEQEQHLSLLDARNYLHAAIDAGLVPAAGRVVSAAPDDDLRQRIAEALREHYLCTDRNEADADGNSPCRCGDWREPGPMGSDEDDWDAHLAEVALAVLPPPADRGAEGEPPLSPYYEHPECGFHWHGRDGMDIPMRDGQPVCPRCKLAAVEKRLHHSEQRREELRKESKRRGKTVLEQSEKIRVLEREVDEVRRQLGAEILRAGQAEAELRRVADEAQQPSPRCTCGETACESELCDCDSAPCPVDHAAEAQRQPDTETRPVARQTLVDLIRDFRDPDPCRLDHHGYCQTHVWMCSGRPCPHARAREVLAAIDSEEAAVSGPGGVADEEPAETRCTCADAGACFAPAGHYADCPQAPAAAVVSQPGKET